MKLVIVITGLVLLAPERDRSGMHLFFPEMDMSHPQAQHHTPYLEYAPAGQPRKVSLEGWTLDLGAVARPGTAATLPDTVVDLGRMFRGVPRDWVAGVPSRRVQGRVSLPWPDAFEVRGTANWRAVRGVSVKDVTLTNEVVLQYEFPNEPPGSWKMTSLPWGPGGETPIPSWGLPGSTDTIHISNLPAEEGPSLTLNDEGVHFQGYVDVLRRRLIDRLRPRPRVFLNETPALSPFNCMLASAPIT